MSLLSTLQSVGTVNASINSKAKQLETFVDNGNAEFNRHINDLASQLEQGSTEQVTTQHPHSNIRRSENDAESCHVEITPFLSN